MAVKPVEPDQGSTCISGHLQAVADRGASMAHQHPVGARPDILAEQLGTTRKPAIGDDNISGTDIHHLAILLRSNANDLALLHAQRCRSGAKKKPTLYLLKLLRQFTEQP